MARSPPANRRDEVVGDVPQLQAAQHPIELLHAEARQRLGRRQLGGRDGLRRLRGGELVPRHRHGGRVHARCLRRRERRLERRNLDGGRRRRRRLH